jgi:Flp pilus assembly protein TadD
LETFIAKMRRRVAEARPPRPTARTLEASDPELAAALAGAVVAPSPRSFRKVAEEYGRLRVADKVYEYLNRAVALDPEDAATHEALARYWRNSGLAQLGLGDAYRALYYAPSSPSTRNTLGTMFQALGRRGDAQREYERALELDPTAAYALNNLCYDWILQGQPDRAASACLKALQLEPGLTAARNNLGLAYAAVGAIDAARAAFSDIGNHAAAAYNLGIVQLARRQYAAAIDAFTAAQRARPAMRLAAARIRQARALSGEVSE